MMIAGPYDSGMTRLLMGMGLTCDLAAGSSLPFASEPKESQCYNNIPNLTIDCV